MTRFVSFIIPPRDEEECYDLITGGDEHVYFWTLDGANIVANESLWADADSKQQMLCGAAIGENLSVSGSASGHLFVWKGRCCDRVIRAHEQAIESMHAFGEEFSTGSRDGFVKLWAAKKLKHLKTFDLSEASVPPLQAAVGSVRAFSFTRRGKVSKLLVGTLSAEIFEIARESGSITLFCEGHFTDDLWACATNPTDPDVFATAGDDETIRVWSINLKRLLRKAKLNGPVRALTWSPDGATLVAGMGGTVSGVRHPKDGVFLVLKADTLDVVHEGRDSRHWIRCVKCSPDGTKIAIGSMDHKVYLYDRATVRLLHKCTKHNSYVTHLDFSADSQFVQSDAADFEHLFHVVEDGSHVRSPSQLKDAEWATWTCIYGWPVQGCWPTLGAAETGRDTKTQITSTDTTDQLVAAGDENGDLRLYRNPTGRGSISVKCTHSHASSISAVAFSAAASAQCSADRHIITTGRSDRSIAVWKVRVLGSA